MDEVAIFNRALTPDEIESHYLRGVMRMQFQVRSCDDVDCDPEPFVGPDGTQATCYELANPALTPPMFPLNVDTNPHFQYRVYMDTDDAGYSPELKSVTVEQEVDCALSGTDTVTCSLSAPGVPLAPHHSVAIRLPVTVTALAYPGATVVDGKPTIVNTVVVDSDASDHNPLDSTAHASTTLREVELTGVTISGPITGEINNSYTFTATVSPDTASLPVTYTWEATNQPITQHVNLLSDTVTLDWALSGNKVITVTAINDYGPAVSDVHTITVVAVDQVVITGPTTGITDTDYSFIATVGPATVTLPITYTWEATAAGGAMLPQPE